MVVLAVTWMSKVGHEAKVAALFEKLTEQSRKEPGCAMYQVHRHKTEPRRFFIYTKTARSSSPAAESFIAFLCQFVAAHEWNVTPAAGSSLGSLE